MKPTIANSFDEQSTRNQETGCWEWTRALTVEGYGQLTYFGRHTVAHRIAWERAFGTIADGKHVLHTCDNPRCVNPAHLWLGTNLDNILDMRAKGREARGTKHGHAKLSEDIVREMRIAVASGVRQSVLADRYGVTRSVVCTIVNRTAWAHVP